MPSHNPETGRPLSGAALRKRAKLRAAGVSPAAATSIVSTPARLTLAELAALDSFGLGVPEPPIAGSPSGVEEWHVEVRIALAVAVENAPAALIQAIGNANQALVCLAKLLKVAWRAYGVVELRRRAQRCEVNLGGDDPPAELAERILWSFCRVARIAWLTTRVPVETSGRLLASAITLAEIARTPCTDYFSEQCRQLEAQLGASAGG